MAIIIENGKQRPVNINILQELAIKYIPVEEYDSFIQEVAFRMDATEMEDIDTNGKPAEEYFFAACLAYAEENGYHALYQEMDDCEIFDYCGYTLE